MGKWSSKVFDFVSKFSKVVAVSFLFCTSAALVNAADLAKPAGEVVLTVSGAITNTNGEGKVAFDLEMLKALPVTTFKTKTTWTEGEKELYRRFHAGASGGCRGNGHCRKVNCIE